MRQGNERKCRVESKTASTLSITIEIAMAE
jgi:hypothetical protein